MIKMEDPHFPEKSEEKYVFGGVPNVRTVL
jgi:hypothetical protein